MNLRYQKILKLAKETLTNYELSKLNTSLSIAHGFEFIDSVLKERGLSRGYQINKDTYNLIRDGELIGNAVLKGNYQKMEIVPKDITNIPKPKKYKIPKDAYTSPSFFYELFEKEKEEKED